MTEPTTCGAALFLRLKGPAQVPFRPCCAVVLLHAAQASDAAPPPCPRHQEQLVGAALFTLRDEVIP